VLLGALLRGFFLLLACFLVLDFFLLVACFLVAFGVPVFVWSGAVWVCPVAAWAITASGNVDVATNDSSARAAINSFMKGS